MLDPDVEEASPQPSRSHAPEDRRIRRAWWALSITLVGLGLVVLVWFFVGGPDLLGLIAVALVAAAAGAAAWYRAAFIALEARRRAETESVARLLRGLSRSVSPDAIVAAIASELAAVAEADHVVVARRRSDPPRLEATLVSARAGIPSSTTTLSLEDLEAPIPAVVAERIARRVRDAYALRQTLAAPLVVDGVVLGALILSRRGGATWPGQVQGLLDEAAEEASIALARATSHRAAETRASTDALTGLPNRRYFDEFCALLARRRRAGDAVGIMMVDIDRFKRLNDTRGHAVGDEVLRSVAGAIASAVRDDDVPARYGGEEFAILLRNPSRDVAVEIGERVRAAVGGLDLRGYGIPEISVSVGVAVQGASDQPIDELIESADRALYRAKRAGRDRVVAA